MWSAPIKADMAQLHVAPSAEADSTIQDSKMEKLESRTIYEHENLWTSMEIYENLQHANHPQIILSLPYGFRKFAGPPESSPWWGFPAAQRYPPANLRFLACRFRPWSAMIFAIPIWHHMASYGIIWHHMAIWPIVVKNTCLSHKTLRTVTVVIAPS